MIVGVTLDEWKNISAETVTAFTEKKEMSWVQVYDDGLAIAQAYQVATIPTPFLVDGDTGKIVAMKLDLRGAALDKTLNKHIAAKMKEMKEKGGTATP